MKKEIVFHLDEEIVYLLQKAEPKYMSIIEDEINRNIWDAVCKESKMTKEQIMNQIKSVKNNS